MKGRWEQCLRRGECRPPLSNALVSFARCSYEHKFPFAWNRFVVFVFQFQRSHCSQVKTDEELNVTQTGPSAGATSCRTDPIWHRNDSTRTLWYDNTQTLGISITVQNKSTVSFPLQSAWCSLARRFRLGKHLMTTDRIRHCRAARVKHGYARTHART